MKYLHTVENTVIVRADHQPEEMKYGLLTLRIHTAYERANPIITGTVLAVPCRLTQDTLGFSYDADVQLVPGDKVWFHHNMIVDSQKIENDAYWMFYEAIYAAERDGRFFVVGDNILVDCVMESEEDTRTASGIYFKSNPEEKYLRGVVKHLGVPRRRERDWFQLRVGDAIIFDEDSEIPLMIDGHRYFRQKYDDVLCVDDGGLCIQGNWVCVAPAAPASRSVLLLAERPADHGRVIGAGTGSSLSPGETVYFQPGMGTKYEGLVFLRETDILLKKVA